MKKLLKIVLVSTLLIGGLSGCSVEGYVIRNLIARCEAHGGLYAIHTVTSLHATCNDGTLKYIDQSSEARTDLF
jgi:hypothetical protein